jgi:hypothetical protein
LPKCNHKQICWRCCINMIKEGKFGCPFCKVFDEINIVKRE